jgi:hypothetical protein
MIEAAPGGLPAGRGLSNRTMGMMLGFGASALNSAAFTGYLTRQRPAAGSQRQALARYPNRSGLRSLRLSRLIGEQRLMRSVTFRRTLDRLRVQFADGCETNLNHQFGVK